MEEVEGLELYIAKSTSKREEGVIEGNVVSRKKLMLSSSGRGY